MVAPAVSRPADAPASSAQASICMLRTADSWVNAPTSLCSLRRTEMADVLHSVAHQKVMLAGSACGACWLAASAARKIEQPAKWVHALTASERTPESSDAERTDPRDGGASGHCCWGPRPSRMREHSSMRPSRSTRRSSSAFSAAAAALGPSASDGDSTASASTAQQVELFVKIWCDNSACPLLSGCSAFWVPNRVLKCLRKL